MKLITTTLALLKAGSCLAALFFAVAGAGGMSAAAHPHAWIDLQSTVLLDGKGRIVAIEQQWLFDEFYTLFSLDGLKPSADRDPLLTELARVNLGNLRDYDYFTEISTGDVKVPLGTVEEFETALRSGRLWMRFVVPLDRPIDPREDQVKFAIFDPTYYVEMRHVKGTAIAFRGEQADGCSGRITPPNPSFETIMLAAAIDRNTTASDTLGELFAEKVEIACR
jgi:ABC-type uncharacterized transport system substrate-binding protein